ncbi:MAG: hypothetical protein K0Q87_66 [Neobacillus sp.]|jgi:hypothetical protein|nr:hypothetical protein [Neobacillus sp.]
MTVKKTQQEPTAKNNTNKEKLSTKEIKELMGMGRPTYKRHRGAIKQK